MGQLNYTMEQVHELLRKTWEVKNYIHSNTKHSPLQVLNEVQKRYPASELGSISKLGTDHFRLMTPQRIFVEATLDEVTFYALSQKDSKSHILLFEMCKTEISNECAISTYLNNFFLGLEELTSRHYDDLDLNHEREKAKIIADLISK